MVFGEHFSWMSNKLDEPQYIYSWILVFQVYFNSILRDHNNRPCNVKRKQLKNRYYVIITVAEVQAYTYLYRWDKSQWGRPCLQQERPRERRVSGILVWSACLSGIARRRRLAKVQKHLRWKTQHEDTYQRKSEHLRRPWFMQTASRHKAGWWLRSSLFSMVRITGPFTMALLSLQTWKTNTAQMIVSHALSVFVF